MKILLVDDDRNIQKMYSGFLKDEGFEVYQALNAEASIQILRRKPVDLVLLDIKMPDVDGFFMRKIIHSINPKIKVIVASVYPVVEQKKRIAHADDYFDKSQGTELLLKTIAMTLQKSSSLPRERVL